MIIEPIVTPLGLGTARVAWSGTGGSTVRVFVNGLLIFGPVVVAGADKTVDVSLPDPGTLEVHENSAGEVVPAASIALERRPLVWWSSVDGAVEYRVYFDDVVVAVVPHESWRLHHQVVIPSDVRLDGGFWRELRVEAVSSSGAETASTPTPHFAPGVPLAPADVVVTGGGGVFDIEVQL